MYNYTNEDMASRSTKRSYTNSIPVRNKVAYILYIYIYIYIYIYSTYFSDND